MKELKLWKTFGGYKPHKNCSYPADEWNYCWAWATAIDNNEQNRCIKEVCISCEFFIKGGKT